MSGFSKGDSVSWSWGNGTGTGKVKQRFTSDVERTIKGSKVKREASEDEPAYLIEQDDGDEVLKSGSELKAAKGSSKGSSRGGSKGSSSGGSGGEDLTKDEFYEKAKKQDVEGRSKMSKDELAKAVGKGS